MPDKSDPGYAWLKQNGNLYEPYDDWNARGDADEPQLDVSADLQSVKPKNRAVIEKERENALENVKYLEEKYIELSNLGDDTLSYGISYDALDKERKKLKQQLEWVRDIYDSYGDRLAEFDAAEIVEKSSGGTLPKTAEYLDFELNHAAKGQPYMRVATEYGYDTRGENSFLSLAREELKSAGYTAEQIANFVETVAREVNASLTAAQNETVYKMSQANPIMAAAISGLSFPLQAASGLAMFQPIFAGLGGSSYTSLDTNGAFFAPMNATNAIRSGVKDKTNWTVNGLDVFDFGYDLLMGAGDAAMAYAMPGGSRALRASAHMASETAVATMKEAAERGCSRSEAFSTGLMAGLIDLAANRVSFGNLDGIVSTSVHDMKTLIKSMAKQAGIDFTQTELSETAKFTVDAMKNGDASEYAQLVRQCKAENPELDEDGAKQLALMKAAGRTFKQSGGAALGGIVLSGAGAAAGRIKGGGSKTSGRESGALDFGEWDNNLTPDGKQSFEADYTANARPRQVEFDADEQALGDAISHALAESRRLEGDSTTSGGVALLERPTGTETAAEPPEKFDNFEIVDEELTEIEQNAVFEAAERDWESKDSTNPATIRGEGLRNAPEDDINADIAGKSGGSALSVVYGSRTKTKAKIARQMNTRGWTSESVENTVRHPYTTRRSFNRAENNTATAYFNKDGSYVVVDDITHAVVQVSNRNDQNWQPDSIIEDPYIAGIDTGGE